MSFDKALAWMGIGLASAVLAYTGLKPYYWQTDIRMALHAGVPLLIIAICLFSLRLVASNRLLLLVHGIAVMVAVLAVEAVTELGWLRRNPSPISEASGEPLAIPAYHALCGYMFTQNDPRRLPVPRVDGRPLLPVGGLSGAPIRWIENGYGRGVYHLDEYGFTNPPGTWQTRVDALAIGDSYTIGLEVAPGRGYVDLLRSDLGSTVNLGCNGNGPLFELATLAEYGPVLRPKTVFWFYYEGNDLIENLPAELQNEVLRGYLQNRTQNLYARNSEKDQAWRQVLVPSAVESGSGMEMVVPSGKVHVRSLLTFGALKTALGLQLDYDPAMLPVLLDILSQARALAEAWGGRLVFVYLPSEARHQNALAERDADGYRRKVLRVAQTVGVPIIDVAPEFSAHPSPHVLYSGNHYSRQGYALVADVVRGKLAAVAGQR